MLRTEPRPLTVHDYGELPEGPPYYQLIEGDLETSPSPNRFHQEVLRNIAYILLEFLQRNPLGQFYFAPFDVYLTDLNVFQPDLVFISNARKSILSAQGADGAPDLVVEILSPKTARLDKGVKKEIYARTGVTELWIVDPELRQLQVYHLQKSADLPVATYSGKQKFASALFPGLKLQIGKIFQS